MKPHLKWTLTGLALLTICWGFAVERPAPAATESDHRYLIENDSAVATVEPPPHDGDGMSTAFSYFKSDTDLKLIFRKRVMRPGSTVGYHEQTHDEIYYFASGTADLQMNGKTIPVGPGDAVLTKAGSWHGVKQTGPTEMVFFIVYEEQPAP